MMDTEAFREFKTGLTLLRDNYAIKALPHMRRAVDLPGCGAGALGRKMGRSGTVMRLCGSNEEKSGTALFESG